MRRIQDHAILNGSIKYGEKVTTGEKLPQYCQRTLSTNFVNELCQRTLTADIYSKHLQQIISANDYRGIYH